MPNRGYGDSGEAGVFSVCNTTRERGNVGISIYARSLYCDAQIGLANYGPRNVLAPRSSAEKPFTCPFGFIAKCKLIVPHCRQQVSNRNQRNVLTICSILQESREYSLLSLGENGCVGYYLIMQLRRLACPSKCQHIRSVPPTLQCIVWSDQE